jgi:hypothetical protein
MSINLRAPNITNSAFLIADTGLSYTVGPNPGYQMQLGSDVLPPGLTQALNTSGVFYSPVSAALEINSVTAALLVSRMTEAQRTATTFLPTNGMICYDNTLQSMMMYVDDEWVAISGISPIAPGIAGDIVIFGATPGTLADSGVPIADVAPPRIAIATIDTVKLITDLGLLGFTNNFGAMLVSDSSPATPANAYLPQVYINNTFSGNTQTATLFLGNLATSYESIASSSYSALVELQSTTGCLLLSRMNETAVNALAQPTGGMILYDNENDVFKGYIDGSGWVDFFTGSAGAISITIDAPLKASTDPNPITGVGTISAPVAEQITSSASYRKLALLGGTLSSGGLPDIDNFIQFGSYVPAITGDVNTFSNISIPDIFLTPPPDDDPAQYSARNTIIGFHCMEPFTYIGSGAGDGNSVYGFGCGTGLSVANNNVIMGHYAAPNLITYSLGSIYIGNSAGDPRVLDSTSYTHCIFIGDSAGSDAAASSLTNSIAIGYNVTVANDNQTIIGDTSSLTGLGGQFDPQYTLDLGDGTNVTAINLAPTSAPPTAIASSGNVLFYNDGGSAMLEFDDSSKANILSLLSLAAGAYYFPKIVVNANGTITIDSQGSEDAPNYNLFIGDGTGNNTLTGFNNFGAGISCMPSIDSGNNNTGAGGRNVLFSLTTGSGNAAYGSFALSSSVEDDHNTAIGTSAFGGLNDSGSSINNTALGYTSGNTWPSYIGCTLLGASTDATVNGLTNATAIGYNAKVSVDNALVLGAGAYVGIGTGSPAYTLDLANISSVCAVRMASSGALPATPANTDDIALYNNTGRLNYIDTNGDSYGFLSALAFTSNNMLAGFPGSFTGNATLSGVNNTGLGYDCLTAIDTGNGNCGFGYRALNSLISDTSNTAIGTQALRLLGDSGGGGNNNTALGAGAGGSKNSYINCTLLGTNADCGNDNLLNATAVGFSAIVDTDNSLVLGGTGDNQVNVGIGTTAPKAMLHVVGGQIVNRTPIAAGDSPYSVLVTDYIIGVTGTASPVSVVLPAPSADNTGQIFIVKDESGAANVNNITVTVDGGANIDGSLSAVINVAYASFSFYSNGTQYYII